MEARIITDKKQARSLIKRFYSEKPQIDPEPRCERHGEPISVGAASVSDTFELPVSGCCRGFIDKRVQEITTEEEGRRVKYFPDWTSPEWKVKVAQMIGLWKR